MKKLSHKALKEEGKRLNGTELCCNCYTYENAVHYISKLEEVPAGAYLCGECDSLVNSIIKKIRESFPDAAGCTYTQLFYSSGVYGNNGQLHQFEILNNNWEKTGESFYIYF